MKLLSFTFTFTIHLLEILREKILSFRRNHLVLSFHFEIRAPSCGASSNTGCGKRSLSHPKSTSKMRWKTRPSLNHSPAIMRTPQEATNATEFVVKSPSPDHMTWPPNCARAVQSDDDDVYYPRGRRTREDE